MQQQMCMMSMMAPMMAQMMSSGAMAMMGSPACVPEPVIEEPEEAERRMGQQVMANTMAALSRRDAQDDVDEGGEDGVEDVAPGPSSNVRHPNYRPADMEIVPGLTDRRFEGVLRLWVEDKGFGFIMCEEIRQKYPDDVFLHQNQKRHFVRGDHVSFNVFLNFMGKPQATELRRRS